MGKIKLVFNPAEWWLLTKKSLPFGINMFALQATYRLDTLFLGFWWGLATVGLYNAAYNLIFTLATISNSINLSLFPFMNRRFAENPEAARKDFGNYLRWLLIISLPLAVIGSVLADNIVNFLFSSTYFQSGEALRILVWVLPFMFINELLGYIGATLELQNQVARLRIVNAVANLSLNLVAIPLFGLYGACVTTIITEAVGVAQFVILFRRQGVFPVKPDWLWRTGLAGLAAGAVALMLHGIPVILAGILALTVYIVALFLTGALAIGELKQVGNAFRYKLNRRAANPEPVPTTTT